MTSGWCTWYKALAPTLPGLSEGPFMACGCGGKQWKGETGDQAAKQTPALVGQANPAYTWPPRGNGPAPKA